VKPIMPRRSRGGALEALEHGGRARIRAAAMISASSAASRSPRLSPARPLGAGLCGVADQHGAPAATPQRG
jgi:hypothetical protein